MHFINDKFIKLNNKTNLSNGTEICSITGKVLFERKHLTNEVGKGFRDVGSWLNNGAGIEPVHHKLTSEETFQQLQEIERRSC